jgi:hypothetical protein
MTGRIMSMKNSNDTIGNRSRDLPVCSAVSQSMHYSAHPKFHGIGVLSDGGLFQCLPVSLDVL